nr:IS1595 family transposase [Parerythrobacter lutipelagi]
MFKVRFGKNYPCPKCTKAGPWYLNTRRYFGCSRCGTQLNAKSGTVFNHSKSSIVDHFMAIYLSCISTYGVPADVMSTFLGLPKPTAWMISNRVRRHIAGLRQPQRLGGEGQIIEVDETLLRQVRSGPDAERHVTIFGITDGHEYLSFIVPNRKPATLLPIIDKWVRPGSEIHSDGFGTYRLLNLNKYTHKTVNHKAGFTISPDGASTVRIDQFWGRLKRTIYRVCHGVHYAHLESYLKECEQRAFWKKDRLGFLNSAFSQFPVVQT